MPTFKWSDNYEGSLAPNNLKTNEFQYLTDRYNSALNSWQSAKYDKPIGKIKPWGASFKTQAPQQTDQQDASLAPSLPTVSLNGFMALNKPKQENSQSVWFNPPKSQEPPKTIPISDLANNYKQKLNGIDQKSLWSNPPSASSDPKHPPTALPVDTSPQSQQDNGFGSFIPAKAPAASQDAPNPIATPQVSAAPNATSKPASANIQISTASNDQKPSAASSDKDFSWGSAFNPKGENQAFNPKFSITKQPKVSINFQNYPSISGIPQAERTKFPPTPAPAESPKADVPNAPDAPKVDNVVLKDQKPVSVSNAGTVSASDVKPLSKNEEELQRQEALGVNQAIPDDPEPPKKISDLGKPQADSTASQQLSPDAPLFKQPLDFNGTFAPEETPHLTEGFNAAMDNYHQAKTQAEPVAQGLWFSAAAHDQAEFDRMKRLRAKQEQALDNAQALSEGADETKSQASGSWWNPTGFLTGVGELFLGKEVYDPKTRRFVKKLPGDWHELTTNAMRNLAMAGSGLNISTRGKNVSFGYDPSLPMAIINDRRDNAVRPHMPWENIQDQLAAQAINPNFNPAFKPWTTDLSTFPQIHHPFAEAGLTYEAGNDLRKAEFNAINEHYNKTIKALGIDPKSDEAKQYLERLLNYAPSQETLVLRRYKFYKDAGYSDQAAREKALEPFNSSLQSVDPLTASKIRKTDAETEKVLADTMKTYSEIQALAEQGKKPSKQQLLALYDGIVSSAYDPNLTPEQAQKLSDSISFLEENDKDMKILGEERYLKSYKDKASNKEVAGLASVKSIVNAVIERGKESASLLNSAELTEASFSQADSASDAAPSSPSASHVESEAERNSRLANYEQRRLIALRPKYSSSYLLNRINTLASDHTAAAQKELQSLIEEFNLYTTPLEEQYRSVALIDSRWKNKSSYLSRLVASYYPKVKERYNSFLSSNKFTPSFDDFVATFDNLLDDRFPPNTKAGSLIRGNFFNGPYRRATLLAYLRKAYDEYLSNPN